MSIFPGLHAQLLALQKMLEPFPWAYTLIAAVGLMLLAWLANWITKRVLIRGLRRVLQALPQHDHSDHDRARMTVIPRLANIVPAVVLGSGAAAVPGLPDALVTVIRNVCGAFVILMVAMAIWKALDWLNFHYQRRPDAHDKPIKGYLQITKIGVSAVAAILIIATLVDKSPLILLSGLGAMAAVLMLVFQDTLLSLVASVQLSTTDMVRVGDWIEMPQLNADGDVIDIALHTVKVQNWDKTITTIPTKKLISDSFKNWRGMTEAGGRRIKRSLYLDQTSVRFLQAEEVSRLKRFMLLRGYLGEKERELSEWNTGLAGTEPGAEAVNMRRVTNLGTFRAYVRHYLRHNPDINQSMTLLVRQLQPSATGLPLEIYCFTSDTAWSAYENAQSDIFDHLLAILPEFGLRVFQDPSGADFHSMIAMRQ